MSGFVCRKDGDYCDAHGGAPMVVAVAGGGGACKTIGAGGLIQSFTPMVTSTSATAAATKATKHFYRIGTPKVPWGDSERAAWLADVGIVQRSYADEVLSKLEALKDRFDVVQYGALTQDTQRYMYPLFCIKTKGFDPHNGNPCVLITVRTIPGHTSPYSYK